MSVHCTGRFAHACWIALAMSLVGAPLAAQSADHPANAPAKAPADAPVLGVQGMDSNGQPELPAGVTVVSTTEGGPAEAAGLLPGDLIEKIGAEAVPDLKMLQRVVRGHKIGDTVEVAFKRAGEDRTTRLTLASARELGEKIRRRDHLIGLPLPPLRLAGWAGEAVDPASLQGKVVVLGFFEMLCPGSQEYGLGRAQKWWEKYGSNPNFRLIGVHSVWEMHERQTPEALKEFVQRRSIPYPVAIDQIREGTLVPETLWACRILTPDRRLSTPGLVIVDRKGIVRFKAHGGVDEPKIEELIDRLLAEEGK